MSANYSATSPYFQTGYSQFFLEVMINRPIPKSADDILFTLNTTYQYRPDLLAFDLYGDSQLWWVFYQRNPNTLTAPPMDFEAGTSIYLPKLETLKTVLGF
jgi:hypothetical protein